MTTPSTLLVVARHELKTLARERTFLLLFGIFFVMTFFSVYIGWSTRTTVSAIYDATVLILHAGGAASTPPNPILMISPLAVFDNMIIYFLLVGALLSIVIGHQSFIRERRSGVIPLVFARPLSKGTYISGKMFGILIALAAIVTSTFLVSVFSVIFIPALHFSGPEFIRLGGFYAVSFLYLAFFALLGLVCAIRFTSESVALFTPIMVWIALMFIFPELATGQNPVALLNPITLSQAAAPQGAFFSLMHTVLWPFSAGQHYTASAMMFLEAGPNAGVSVSGGMAQVGSSLMALITYLALLVGASVYAARSYVIASDPLV